MEDSGAAAATGKTRWRKTLGESVRRELVKLKLNFDLEVAHVGVGLNSGWSLVC